MSGHCAFSALSFAAAGLLAAVVSATAFSTSAALAAVRAAYLKIDLHDKAPTGSAIKFAAF
ncbi:hypothetical protein [Bradyrhizobium sp. 145]|uniref:hypothetical protein n=1 Tax=Bradyrhizobium sp. 145 TaxID=2782621 RepID=UPI001FF95428|nr:hypothetical protein [Bradyrhizobium sp. 145]MCK1687950.1 hypothetical protein [Bradyrhizobium sp. 145]